MSITLENTTIEDQLKGPLFFERNRVNRIYTGGALFAPFFGDQSLDGFEPEEWVASAVTAINKQPHGDKEGISRLQGTGLYFDELLKEYPNQLLGDRSDFGVLTKILDSAIRLPIQVHPDKAFSRCWFNSNYGKAESWVVLATRPGACIYFGFQDRITKEDFRFAVSQTKNDKKAIIPLVNRVPVKPGDIFYVPARMVHAIGAGCLMLEVQEPSDFTIQPEYWCDNYKLNEQEMYMGLTQDTALDAFDYTLYGDRAVAMGRRHPVVLSNCNGIRRESLISYEDTPCFAIQRHTLTAASENLEDSPAVYVVTKGQGCVRWLDQKHDLKQGDYFFLPYAAKGHASIQTHTELEIVVCLPPKIVTKQ